MATAIAPLQSESEPLVYEWDVEGIVAELRELRNASLAMRQRLDKPVRLPLRSNLISIMAGLNAVLFPNRLGNRVLTQGSIDFYVGHTLDTTLRELCEQVTRELLYVSSTEEPTHELHNQAVQIVRQFAKQLPSLRRDIEADILAAYEADPSARSHDEILACYPGVVAIIHYRIAHALWGLGTPLIARILSEIAHSVTGCEIHPAARIGKSFYISHGTGVVIGQTAQIGNRVRLSQGVTLAAISSITGNREWALGQSLLHPVIEDDVIIYAGTTLLGPITIGQGSIIGGNVWLTHDIPPHSNITQAKVRYESFGDGAGI